MKEGEMEIIAEFLNKYSDVIFWISIVIATALTILDSLKLKGKGQLTFVQFYKLSYKRSYIFIMIALSMLILF